MLDAQQINFKNERTLHIAQRIGSDTCISLDWRHKSLTEKKTLCRVPSVQAVFLQIQFDYYEKNRLQSVNKCDNIFLVNTNVFLVRT